MEPQNSDKYQGKSLGLAYEHIKGLVEAQKAHGAHLDSKSSTMIAVATAIVGIAVPLVLDRFWKETDATIWGFQLTYVVLALVLLPVIAYIYAFVVFWRTFRLADYHDTNEPNAVKAIIGQDRQTSYATLYKAIEDAYSHNKKITDRKVKNFTWLLRAFGTETLLIVAWSLLVAIASSRT